MLKGNCLGDYLIELLDCSITVKQDSFSRLKEDKNSLISI